ncbi:hypothetical protein B566_EDAN016627 [Ephemera danica]|nr:hypothetical protein B566_EDAN016627 [Ephemera danica]
MIEIHSKDSQVFVVIGSLVESAADKDDEVKSSVAVCLRDLAKTYPDEVLQTICTYRKNHPKMSTFHTATLLHIAEQICKVADVTDIDEESTVTPLVELAVSEMTKSIEMVPEWQMPASQLLVALGRGFCVMEGLLRKFQPGVVPHYFVLHTLGSLAATNSYAMVPYMKACLGTLLPMMGALRVDALKQAYPSVTTEAFSTELGLAMGMLLGSWLSASRDQQMLESVLHAMAAMYPLLPKGRAAELAPRLLPALLGLKRRPQSGSVLPLAATRCLASVLAQLTSEAPGSAAIEPGLDGLLSSLSDLVFEAPDLEQPLTIKNHYEALRCFDTLARRFPERVSGHLTGHLRSNNERERARALVVLAHLVSCDHAERHLPDLVASVRSLTNDTSTKVRRAIVKVVVTLAHKGHLNGTEGADFLLFIINNSIVQPQHPTAKVETWQQIEQDELRQVCCDSLVLLSSAAPQVARLMRPLLLQCLVQAEFGQVSGLLARCVNSINSRADQEEMQEEEDPTLHTPRSLDVLARCVVLLGSPLPENGIHILHLLKGMKMHDLHSSVQNILEKWIPRLTDLIQGPSWDESQWEEKLLELVRELGKVEALDWMADFSKSLGKQGQQILSPRERQAQLTSLACLAACCLDNKLATMVIQDALDAARLFPGCEQVCATAVAECACGSVGKQKENTQHLQLALSQLRLTAKDLPSPHSSTSSAASKLLPAFLASIGASDRSRKGEIAAGSERLRAAILLSYGELARRAPGVEILPKIESAGIVDWMVQQLQNTKVAAAFHPDRNSGLVVLEHRKKALTLAVSQLALGKPDITALALSLTTSLVLLPPHLDSDSRMLVLKSGLDKVLNSLVVNDAPLLKGLEKLCGAAMLSAGVAPASLDELQTLLEPWLRSSSLVQRTAATTILASALAFYAAHLQFGYESPSSFSVASSILSRAVPRCTDLSPECRTAGVQCVRLALLIAASYEGRQSSDVEKELDAALGSNSKVGAIYSDDPNLLYEATMQLARVICCHLPSQQLGRLVEGLVMCLTDPEPVSCAGVSVVLNTVLKEKGGELFHHTADTLELVIKYLPQVASESMKTGIVHCVVSLAKHHPKAVTVALMNQPLPYSLSVQSCWQVLAKEKDLSGEICGCLMSLLTSNPLCEEPRDKTSPRVALPTPLAAISGLHEMFACGAEALSEYAASTQVFPELFVALLLALGGLVGACPPVNMPGARQRATKNALSSTASHFVPNRDAYNLVPGRVALDTLHSFLTCTNLSKAAESLSQCSHVDTGENLTSFITMVPNLIKNVVQYRPQCLNHLVTNLNQHASSNVDSARITVTAVLSELVMWSKADSVLLDGLLQQLAGSLDDSSTVVRQLALQGLSHVSYLEPKQRERYTSMVLDALLQGLEDSPGEGVGLGLAQEALAGLAAILPVVDSKHVVDLQATLALRVRPFFTKDNTTVRAAAFQTLGELCQCGSKTEAKPAFIEQLTSSLINLLIGLCDTELSVVQFPQFATSLVKLMAEEMPDQFPYFVMTSIGFTRSQWPSTRASATLLTGLLYGSMPASQIVHVSLDSVCSRLTQMLTDPNSLVRANAARAISYVFSN